MICKDGIFSLRFILSASNIFIDSLQHNNFLINHDQDQFLSLNSNFDQFCFLKNLDFIFCTKYVELRSQLFVELLLRFFCFYFSASAKPFGLALMGIWISFLSSAVPLFNDAHREKLLYSIQRTRIYWNRSMAASDLFCMFRQSFKFYTFHSHLWFIK